MDAVSEEEEQESARSSITQQSVEGEVSGQDCEFLETDGPER